MKRPSLGARDRRAVRVGALLLAPALVYALMVRPYLSALERGRDALAEERDLLAREQRLVAESPNFPERHRRAGNALGTTWTRIVRGADTLSVAATLASYVSETAEGSGLLVEQVEAHGADSLQTAALAQVKLNAATVELHARGDLRGILAFLGELETGETIVRVDRLRIEHASGATDAVDEEVLGVTATVTGVARVLAHPVSAPIRPASLARHANGQPLVGAGNAATVDGVKLP